LPKDSTDRNRTSPFAFTGNKFEFRMVGSSQSTSGPMFTLNTIVADVLSEISDELEKAKDVENAIQKILRRIANEHKRIIYNGDNYVSEWTEEAQARGLPNIRSTPESVGTIMDKENVELFSKHGVLTKAELHARTDILYEIYSKSINIEALTMLHMAKRQILPAVATYSGRLASIVVEINNVGMSVNTQKAMLEKVCELISLLSSNIDKLEKVLAAVADIKDVPKRATGYNKQVVPAMQAVRQAADELEKIVDKDLWPLPTYAEMLFLKQPI
jgi:glutamine synthetase